MYNKEFVLYMKDNIKLIKSMVIKSSVTVNSFNEYAMSLGYDIRYDMPSTFPYYLNLSGEYHSMNRKMEIYSLDTLEKINFDKVTLAKHHNTLREYRKLGDYYMSLIEAFPDQEILIRGILNPIPIDNAINANNGEILFYNKTLVESNEHDLIPTLQAFIYMFYDNWYNEGYKYTDELFDAGFFGVLAAGLVTRVLSARLSKCGTNQVHSFHLWAKLGSHFYLDRYKDYIPRETAMWLYRNIDDIRANLGQNATFNKLLDNLLTANKIPVSHLIMKNAEEQLDKAYLPEPYIFKHHLNTQDTGIASDNIISTSSLLNRMTPLAEHNPKNITFDIDETNYRSCFSPTSSNHTKVFEAILGHGDTIDKEQLMSDILNYLAFTIFTGLYQRFVIIKNTKGELVKVTIEEAFIIWIYIANKLNWIPFTVVPEMVFKRVPNMPYGSFDDYRKASHPTYVDDIEIKTALLSLESNEVFDNSEMFIERAYKYNENKYRHFLIYSTRHDLNSYVRVRQMVDMFYTTRKFKCNYSGKSYASFFDEIGIAVDEYETSYLEILFLSLFEDMTGLDYNGLVSASAKQLKLVEVVKLLSSYTIQFITQETTSNASTKNPTGLMKMLRPTCAVSDLTLDDNILLPELNVNNITTSGEAKGEVILPKLDVTKGHMEAILTDRIIHGLEIWTDGRYKMENNVPLSMVRIIPRRSIYLPDYLPNNKLNGLIQFKFTDELTRLDLALPINLLKGLRDDINYDS
jgi:hypothetical protein